MDRPFVLGVYQFVIWTTQTGVLRPIVILQAALGDQSKGACRSMVAYHRSDVLMLELLDQVVVVVKALVTV